jgi:hypothetical protein
MLRAGGAGAMGGRPKSGVPGPLAACLLEEISAQPETAAPGRFCHSSEPLPARCQRHVAIAANRLRHAAVSFAVALDSRCEVMLTMLVLDRPMASHSTPFCSPARAP